MTLEKQFPIFEVTASVVIIAFMFLASVKSCSEENTSHARFDPTTAARMYIPLASDTTKKPQPKLINHYTLSGNDTLFNLLWMQITSPGDVTPNQKTKLQNWISKDLKQDTLVTNKN